MDRRANWCSHGRWFTLAINMGYNGNVRLQQQAMGMLGWVMGVHVLRFAKWEMSNKIIKTK
jgi:hypothetical protein